MAESEKAPTTRRGMLRGLAGTLGAALALTATGKQSPAAETPATLEARPQAAGAPLTTDPLGRMHSELAHALAKPREQRRWVMSDWLSVYRIGMSTTSGSLSNVSRR